jgi:hypothetical protein
VLSFVTSGIGVLGASEPIRIPRLRRSFAARAPDPDGLRLRVVELEAGYLNAAVRWFRIALLALLGLAALIVLYAAVGS